jgi:hypothetical protein
MRHVFLVIGAASLLLIPALASSAAHQSRHSTGIGPLGAVPPHVDGKTVGHLTSPVAGKRVHAAAAGNAASGPTKADNLTYGNADQLDPNTDEGGPVMHSSKVYAMYWVPAGYSQSSNYQTLINRFFTDVAADSGTGGNVYSTLQQYYDTTGGIEYSASWGGSAVDTNAFPSDGCDINQYDGFTIQNTTNCLDDTQLQEEIQAFADAQHWDHGPNVQIFLFTPKNVASCIDDPFNSDFGQDCSYSDYCAYHSAFFSGGSTDTDTADEYIYANMPWPNQQIFDGTNTYTSDCDGGDHPNGDGTPAANDTNAADEVLGVTSHEHSEAWTDPLGTGWWVDNDSSAYAGFENGDLCAWYFPSRAKSTGSPAIDSGNAYDQVINGHHYFVQGEWSNKNATSAGNSGCVWSFGYPTESTLATISGTATVGHVLNADAGSWTGSPTSYKYEWLRCDSSGDQCKLVKTTLSATTSATYALVSADDKHTMRVRVTATNTSGHGSPATSDATSVVDGEPVLTANPIITGTTDVGHTLTATNLGTWSPAATSYKTSWLRCDNAGANCKVVKAATVTAAPVSYALTKADDKMTIRLQIVATNSAGVSDTYLGDANGPIGGEPESTGGGPAISGGTTVGSTLTGDVGSWSHVPTSYAYSWLRCSGTCKVIKKGTLKQPATTTTYKLTKADDKATIQFQAVGSNSAGSGDTASDQVGPITGEPADGTARITGTASVGQTLTATTGDWSPAATKYKYDWLRCDNTGNSCKVFKSATMTATSMTYKLVAADATHTIKVTVTASNAAGSSDPKTSTATAVVTSV